MGKAQTIIVQRGINWGNGLILGLLVILLGAGLMYLLYRVFIFAWPTLVWLVPTSAYIIYLVWEVAKAVHESDEVRRSVRSYKATVLLLSNLLIIGIIIWDMKPVVGP